jgi:hypothetical protein
MPNVISIATPVDVLQRHLDSYVKKHGAVLATAVITFEDGRQIVLSGQGDEVSQPLEFLLEANGR